MAAITIKDLPTSRQLDSQAMSSITGGGAPWLYGWVRAYSDQPASFGTVVNFYQINNYAEQMINQIQVVDINNAAANANINVALDANSNNTK